MNVTFSILLAPQWAEWCRLFPYSIAVMGNQSALGNWTSPLAIMSTNDYRFFSVSVDLQEVCFPIEYKYVLIHSETKEILAWEKRFNRELFCLDKKDSSFFDTDIQFDFPYFRFSGVSIPVFSLRTKNSGGIGEFLDLKLMIDWAVETKQHLIQTLPINDTTLTHTISDSYPYNALSVFALHPLYLSCFAMGVLSDSSRQLFFEKQFEKLNSLKDVDYESVDRLKWTFFRELFEQEKKTFEKSKEYKSWFKQNKSWLLPYAVFSVLRDRFQTANFQEWKEGRKYTKSFVVQFEKANREDVLFYCFLQYNAYLQMSEVKRYATQHHVLLKGDVPIGVSPNSVDVWVNPSLFNLNGQAGAPPDDFSEKGQNWGFPTYNWDKMEQDDFSWWKARFAMMSKYFDAYRIDHILGFFRIWENPSHAIWGLLGQFNKAQGYTKEEIAAFGFSFDEERDLYPDGQNENTYLSQKQIEQLNLSEEDKKMMLKKACQVLFVRDREEKNCFHPRISYSQNEAFVALSESQQQAYKALYEYYFYHRNEELWRQQAYRKLPTLLSSTSMLACGEDLGMIPSCVSEVMRDLQILSLEIQRMPKQPWREFDDLNQIEYLSVCTTSTHDMSPIRLWWEEDADKSVRYAEQMGFEYEEKCSSEIAKKIILNHLNSPAMWVILPFQDWSAIEESLVHFNPSEERINVPDNPHNEWKYRMHISLEQLLDEKKLNQQIIQLLTLTNRF